MQGVQALPACLQLGCLVSLPVQAGQPACGFLPAFRRSIVGPYRPVRTRAVCPCLPRRECRVRNGAGKAVRAVVLLREDTRRASQGTGAPLPVQHPSLFPGCARRRGAREGSTLRAKRGAWLPTAPAASRSRFARRLGGSSDLLFGVEPTTLSGSSRRRNYERHRRMSTAKNSGSSTCNRRPCVCRVD